MAKSESATRFFFLITLLSMPHLENPVEHAVRTEIKRRVLVTAVALRRYRLKHGKYPSELSALAPEFIRIVPRDCMDARPLKYRLENDAGAFTLYSIGLDGVDQGGDPTPRKAGLTKFEDGLDVVWSAR